MRTELQQGAAERQWAERRRETATARLGPWLRQTAAMVLPAALGLGLLFAAWEAWVQIKDVKPYLLPAPSAVFERLYEDPWLFIEEGLATLQAALLGFGAGAGIALALAVLMSQGRPLERAILGPAIMLKVTPIVVIAPLLIIWFGFGLWPKVFIAGLIAFFPIMINALIGFRSVNPNALALMESLSASKLEVFLRLRLPSSLPYLFAAFRFSVPLSMTGAVVAEWFSGDRGLGSLIYTANQNLHMDTAFAGIFTLAVIGVALFLTTVAIERRVLSWHESTWDVR